jgi:hypothetical protein
MRIAVVAAALLAVAASRHGCGDGNGYEPCAGKACGAACALCAPDYRGCVEIAVVKACDAGGRCVPSTPEPSCPHPDCAGKLCGDGCNPCGPERTCPTLMPSACDRFGQCSGAVPGLCDGECAGKACGAPCRPADCPLGAPCPAPWACDGNGACVSPTGLACGGG